MPFLSFLLLLSATATAEQPCDTAHHIWYLACQACISGRSLFKDEDTSERERKCRDWYERECYAADRHVLLRVVDQEPTVCPKSGGKIYYKYRKEQVKAGCTVRDVRRTANTTPLECDGGGKTGRDQTLTIHYWDGSMVQVYYVVDKKGREKTIGEPTHLLDYLRAR